MPRNGYHPLALFSLVPRNDRAIEVLNHPENAHLVSSFTERGHGACGTISGLDIGPHIGSQSRYTLATIGRCGDIMVEGADISRIQCSFEIHEGNKQEIMLQDRSTNRSTQFFGETAKSFEQGRTHRRVVVDRDTNLELGFGGIECDMYQFRIVWHEGSTENSDINDREDNPRQTRTILNEPPTIAPSQPITRIHTAGSLEKIRYSMRGKIGSGSFGEVWKVADVDSGKYLAVKRVKRPAVQSREYILLQREVETLLRISHRNVIEFRGAQWEDEHFNIFMDLKAGSVENLIQNDLFIRYPHLANSFLEQMLQALDYLASENIIHRDVKPENILYTITSEGYLYQLADFGLANKVDDSQTFAGSSMYMAPELYNGMQTPQTSKMDVWSLFVTLAYAMNAAGFRNKQLHLRTTAQRMKAIQDAANDGPIQALRDMVIEDPSQRASAADMLDRLFGPSKQRIKQDTCIHSSHWDRRSGTGVAESGSCCDAASGARESCD